MPATLCSPVLEILRVRLRPRALCTMCSQLCCFENVNCNIGHPFPSRPHPPLTRSPFSYKEKTLTPLRVEITRFRGRRSFFRTRRAKRCRAAGGAKPIAGRGGLEGFTPPHQSRRGQRLPTDSEHSPAPARSARLRFAVRSLSEALDRESNQIPAPVLAPHPPLPRSPFPS